jgi:hypothetical protein
VEVCSGLKLLRDNVPPSPSGIDAEPRFTNRGAHSARGTKGNAAETARDYIDWRDAVGSSSIVEALDWIPGRRAFRPWSADGLDCLVIRPARRRRGLRVGEDL